MRRALHVVSRQQEADPTCRFTATKTGRERIVELPAQLVTGLKAWALACPKAVGLVFPNCRDSGTAQGTTFLNAFKRAVKGAGIPAGVRLHDARHSFLNPLMADGWRVPDLARAAGHSTPATTMRFYAHARPSERFGAADKLAALTRGEVARVAGDAQS